MTMPEIPKQAMDHALEHAWAAAERCEALLADGVVEAAAAWAASSQAWSAISTAITERIRG